LWSGSEPRPPSRAGAHRVHAPRGSTRLLELTVSLADEHGLSAYDASYVAAAELTGWTLVSGDHADLVEPGLAITAEQALDAGY
jgi:predicted nucleic acid-binding protein